MPPFSHSASVLPLIIALDLKLLTLNISLPIVVIPSTGENDPTDISLSDNSLPRV